MQSLKNKKEEEINKAILEWLISKNYTKTVDSFLSDAELKKEDATKGSALDKKWSTILTLQKKILDYELQIKQLKEEVELGGAGVDVKKINVSMGIPRAPAKGVLKGQRGAITCLIFHPIYNYLVSGSEDATIAVWECDGYERQNSKKAHKNTVNGLAFDSLGKNLASCSSDLSIKIWNFDTLTCVKELLGHEHSISSVEFTPDGNFLFSGSRDKTVKFWEVSTGNEKKTFLGHKEWVRSVSINKSGNLLASAGDDELIIVWNVETGGEMYTLSGHSNKIESVLFVKNEIANLNIYESDYVESFNTQLTSDTVEEKTGESALNELNKKLNKINAKEQKINKEYLISASRDKSIKIWDVYGSSCICTLLGHDNWVRSLVTHPNGKYIVSSSDDKNIIVWELKSGRPIKRLIDAHDKFVVSLAVNSKFLLLASGSNDQTIKIWDCK
jgi:platelet-activating factor acetylhydrolase IB subunit alpha